jgi:3'-5' exoribonuclease
MIQRALADLAPGARVEGLFLLVDLESRGTDNPFTVLTLSNAGGRIQSAPFWASDGHRLAGIRRGDAVRVTGTVRPYRDQRQLAVETIHPIPRDQADWRVLMPSTGDVAPYWTDIDRWRGLLTAPRLTRTLELFFGDAAFRDQFQECPASSAGHHAELGGLLKHTCEVAHIALAVAAHYPSADTELLLAGALLHDIGKLDSYRWDGIIEATVPGTVIGHVVLGCLMLDRRVRAASPMPCTPEELLLLQHLILTHHGKLEFGAPVLPLTLEAEILHHADNCSAKATSMAAALQLPEHFPAEAPISSKGIWQIDRRRAWRGRSDWGRQPGRTPGAP